MDDHEIQQRLIHLENASGIYEGLTYSEWIEYGHIKMCTKAYLQSHPEISDRLDQIHKKMDAFKTSRPYSHNQHRVNAPTSEKALAEREAAVAAREKQLQDLRAIVQEEIRKSK